MIKLKTVTINKYKSIQQTQSVDIESDITTIVRMNEAGKTPVPAFYDKKQVKIYFLLCSKFFSIHKWSLSIDYSKSST